MMPIPKDMQVAVDQVKRASSKSDALQTAYDILSKRYKGQRIKTYTRIFSLLHNDINTLWNKQGFLHCNHINTLLIELLVLSGHFEREDIQRKWTLVWYTSPHQYVLVCLDLNTRIDVDIWGKNYGIPFSKHAYGFNTTLTAIN